MEQQIQELKNRIEAASKSRTPLCIRAGGSKDWYGQEPRGELLDMSAHRGIVAYDPSELVITARCGTPLAEIEAALAEKNQMLAFEPPHFGPSATVGGAIAAGLSGPRRASAGALRDFVLGVALMDGNGQVLRFGGQVMKNVAGYDVSRMLAGSLGTLGLILEVSLKVLPKPFFETTLHFGMSESEAIHSLNTWGGQPLPLAASVWQEGVLMLRLSGAKAAVEAAHKKLGGERVEQADSLWTEIREQRTEFFASAANGLWRLSVPSVTPPLALPGTQMIEWGGAQRWLKTDAEAGAIRAAAERAGGHACLFRGGDKAVGVFHPLAPAVAKIHRNLKAAFDPAGVFNPGRMFAEF